MRTNRLTWILLPLAGLTLAALAAVAWRLSHPPQPPPADAAALAERVRPLGLRERIVGPVACYVFDGDRTPEELDALPYNPSRVGEWKGVALCQRERIGADAPRAGEERFAGWVLYGDPAMIERLRSPITSGTGTPR